MGKPPPNTEFAVHIHPSARNCSVRGPCSRFIARLEFEPRQSGKRDIRLSMMVGSCSDRQSLRADPLKNPVAREAAMHIHQLAEMRITLDVKRMLPFPAADTPSDSSSAMMSISSFCFAALLQLRPTFRKKNTGRHQPANRQSASGMHR